MGAMKDLYTAAREVPQLEGIPAWEVTFPNGETKMSTSADYADAMRDTFDAMVQAVTVTLTPTLELKVTR